MNFFQSQDDARRKTRSLILMFMLAVIAIVVAVNLVITALIINVGDDTGVAALPDFNWLMNNWPLVASISLATIGFISLSSLYKIASLSSGGGKVARSLGGTLITAESKDPLRRRLYNVVEEMAIASGIPMPEAVGALFSVMAKQGHTEAGAAYQKGMECLARHEQRIKMLIDTKQWPDYEPPQDWVSATDAALKQLDGLQMLDKQALVSALVLTLSHDGKVSPHEAELLRAICATLHCPLPPFVFDADSI